MTITETMRDDYGTFTQVWHCTPPAGGETFRVVKDEWTGIVGQPIRHIYAVEIIPLEAP